MSDRGRGKKRTNNNSGRGRGGIQQYLPVSSGSSENKENTTTDHVCHETNMAAKTLGKGTNSKGTGDRDHEVTVSNEDLRKLIIEIEAKINDNTTREIQGLERQIGARIDKISSDVSGLQTRVGQLEDDVSNIDITRTNTDIGALKDLFGESHSPSRANGVP